LKRPLVEVRKTSAFAQKAKKQDGLNLYLHIIAHEIRSPFVSIQGYCSLLNDKFKGCLPEEGQEYLERISANLKQVDSLLADITRWAKVSIEENEFKKVPCADLIDASLESHIIHMRQKRIQLDIQRDLPELYCDQNSMILAFSNLIGNAVKYSRERVGGAIQIGYLGDEIFHKFYIKDNGVGFRASERSKVFLLFNRLLNKRNVTGSGLGLSIVKQIIEAHGGEVWVESRKSQGSTFFITLPKNSPDQTIGGN